METLA